MSDDQMITRIAKLLAKAERASTPAEAEAYFAKAQALATANTIALAKARLSDTDSRSVPINKRITIGQARKQVNRHLILLMSAICGANDLKIDIAHNSTYVILYGFPADIETAELLWSRISTQMVRDGEAFLATDVWRKDKRRIDEGWMTRTAPMTKQSARAQYYGSFISTVGNRLSAARAEEVARQQDQDEHQQAGNRTEHEAPLHGTSASAPTTQLALRAKDSEVLNFYRTKSTARGTWSSRSRVTGLSRSAARAGQRDGQRVRLEDQSSVGGGRRRLPR